MPPVAADVARSVVDVSVCVLDARVSCAKWLNRSRCRLEACVGPRNHVFDRSPDPLQDATLFRGTCDVPTDCSVFMSAFAAARGDTAMRPLAELHWTLV